MPSPPLDPAAIASRYDERVDVYVEHWAPLLHRGSLPVFDALGPAAVRSVLEVGAGTGRLLRELAARFPGARITGLDRSRGMLARAAGLPRVRGDASRLPFAAGAFDLVLSAFMLFHVPDPAEALAEAHRVLAPGGRVASITWGEDELSPAEAMWNVCLEEHGAPDAPGLRTSQHELVDTPEAMHGLLAGAGFGEVRTWREPFGHRPDPETFFTLNRRLGGQARRFEAMPADAQAACLAAGRERLASLAPADFEVRYEAVMAVGRRG